MNKTAGLLGVLAILVCMPAVGLAGDYHHGATLQCAQCHVMHGEQSHGYLPNGLGPVTSIGSEAPYVYLLRNEINDLCLTCHDGSGFAPDVLGDNFNDYVRQAGALNRGTTGLPATGHTLDSMDEAPGGDWSSGHGLNCIECHQPHGHNPNGNAYRNLTHDPGTYGRGEAFVSYVTGTNVDTIDVFQIAGGPTMAIHYSYDNVAFNEPNSMKSAYAHFCKGCHTNFHGDKGGDELGGTGGTEWLRHPTNDADVGAVGGGHSNLGVYQGKTNKVHTMSDPNVADDYTPSCMTCHKAHGNQNAFGLIYMRGTGDVDEEGDDGNNVKDLCKQCHVQG